MINYYAKYICLATSLALFTFFEYNYCLQKFRSFPDESPNKEVGSFSCCYCHYSEKDLNMYAIVKFLDENDAPGIVCLHWINQDQSMCFYPNVRTNEARDKLLKRLANPDENWSSCRIKVLHKYSSFSVANSHLRKAEDTSNLESEDEVICRPRKRVKASLKYPGEESDEDFSPDTPPSTLTPPSIQTCLPYPVPPIISSPSSSNQAIIDVSNHPKKSVPARFEKSSACSSNQTVINGKLIQWMADVSFKLKKLEEKMDKLIENQARLSEHNVQEKSESSDHLEALGCLPVSDDKTFTDLNQRLSENGHLRHVLIKVLASVGGRDMRCHIHNMLKKVMNDEVAELYSVTGKFYKNLPKKPFLTTEVWKSIFSACLTVYKEKASEAKMKEAVGDWLCQAKVRKNRRLQRQEKDVEERAELLDSQAMF